MRKGISMVAVVITIIVLIVLTSAVVITGVGAPQQAQLAVFKSNTATIQDAVTMKMGNNMIEGALEGKDNDYKWFGIVQGYNGTGNVNFANGEIIAGENVLPLSTDLRSTVKISEEELVNYYVSEEGKVYHKGFVSDGITYYNNNVSSVTYTMSELMEDTSKGTQGVTITISTPQELKDLATYTNAGNTTKGITFKLMNNIDLNPGKDVIDIANNGTEAEKLALYEWVPIGGTIQLSNPTQEDLDSYSHDYNIWHYDSNEGSVRGGATLINGVTEYYYTKSFNGIFDGNGKEISGLYIDEDNVTSIGLFNDVWEGIVANLGIKNSYVKVNGPAGVFVGYGHKPSLVYNCYNDNVEIYGRNKIGGLVGEGLGTVKKCFNTNTTIEGNNYVGGIKGHEGTVTECYNSNNVTVQGDSHVGGIIGRTSSTISNSYNKSNVSITAYVHVGGIAGSINGNSSTKCINCYNEATVTSLGSHYVAGIVANQGIGNIINCYNVGIVIGKCETAGISGFIVDSSIIQNCYNASDLTTTEIGYYNDRSRLAGIVGRGGSVEYSYNLGNISGLLSNTGGIIGVIPVSGTLTSCFNMGTVTSQVGASGVCKPAGQTNTTLENLSVVINGQTYTTLKSALNAWVDANKTTYPELVHWIGSDNAPILDL